MILSAAIVQLALVISYIGNIFAFRATDPAVMKAHPEPIGPENDRYLVEMANRAAIVVAAWGAEGAYLDRGEAVKRIIPNLHCLGLTKDGHPKHPLYLRKDLEPIIMKS